MIRPIRLYPDPCLLAPARPVERIDDELRALARDMIETMRDANGVGLAAPQVGVARRLVVVDLDPEEHRPVVLVNPVMLRLTGGKVLSNEGCLSFPGVTAKVRRASGATVSALNLDGEVVEYTAEGLIARAFQHELDHLDGLVFIEKMGPTARRTVREALEELEDEYAERRPTEPDCR